VGVRLGGQGGLRVLGIAAGHRCRDVGPRGRGLAGPGLCR
jgi:hypothetical protein